LYFQRRDGTEPIFGTKGQMSLDCPRTKGQRDKLKILRRNRTGFLEAVYQVRNQKGITYSNL
jgi:hypothetical protein